MQLICLRSRGKEGERIATVEACRVRNSEGVIVALRLDMDPFVSGVAVQQ